MIKTYYAFLAIAGGYLLKLVGGQAGNAAVIIIAYGLVALGGLALRRVSSWYFRAAGAALVCSVLRLVSLLWPAAALSLLPAGGVMNALLCLGLAEQRVRSGRSPAAEYALLALAAAQALSGAALLSGLAQSVPFVLENLLLLVNTGGILFLIGMIFDVFRAQKLALQSEAEQ